MVIYYSDIIDSVKNAPKRVKETFVKGWKWTKENSDVLGLIVVPAIGSLVGIAGMAVELRSNKDQFDLAEMRLEQYEDPDTHVIFLLKRPMTTHEAILVNQAVREKRPVEAVLTQLDLI